MSDALDLHRSLLTLDSHIDIPWPADDDPFTSTGRRVDMPKLREGGIWAACIAAYIPQGPLSPEGHDAACDRALAMLDVIGGLGRRGDTRYPTRTCETAASVRAAQAEGAIAIVPCVENGYAVGEDLGMLERFRALGARYLTLTHNGHNLLADSAIPRRDLGDAETRHGGLSGLGRDAVAEMNRLGLLVDVSHASRQTMLQAVQLSATPVVATHSCVRALSDHPRNLDDMQLDALRDTGGLVQITAMPGFLRPKGRRADGAPASVEDFVDHIDYVVGRIGAAHVGISSDFDGGGAIEGWENAAQSPVLTEALMRRGYGPREIASFWGGNFLRLLEVAEQAAA